MRLFPVELFAEYLSPVARAFGAGMLLALALPSLLYPLARRLAARPGPSAPPAKGRSTQKGRPRI